MDAGTVSRLGTGNFEQTEYRGAVELPDRRLLAGRRLLARRQMGVRCGPVRGLLLHRNAHGLLLGALIRLEGLILWAER